MFSSQKKGIRASKGKIFLFALFALNLVFSALPYDVKTAKAALPSAKVIFLTSAGSTNTWTVPDDWSNDNTIEVLGAGGGGRTGGASGSKGGGGGAYAAYTVSGLTPGGSVTYRVGSGGSAGVNGGDTFFNRTAGSANTCADTVSVCAKGGLAGTSVSAGGTGGAVASNKPAGVGFAGGTGGNGNNTGDTGGGGGGAAGPHGIGLAGGASQGATPGAGGGGGGSGGGSVGSAGSTNGGAGGNGWRATGSGAGAHATNLTNSVAGTNGGGGGGGAAHASQTALRAGANGGNAPVWTSTHAEDGSTPSVVNAGPGGGGGGAGAATSNGTGSTGGNGGYGGGGGGAYTTAGSGGQGIIVITYIPSTVTTKTIFLSSSPGSNQTWTVPDDWSDDNEIIVLGAGGGGRTGSTSGSKGGGGGAIATSTITGLSPGGSITYRVGSGGGANTNGGDTFFNRTAGAANTCADTVSVCAKGGLAGTSATAGGKGGPIASNKPAYSGYTGGTGGSGSGTGDTGGGGGSGASILGAGRNGGAGQGAAPGAGGGGGGAGAIGAAGASTIGGAGGAGFAGTGGGAGATWNPPTASVAGTNGGGGGGGLGTTTAAELPKRAGANGGNSTVWTSTHAADGVTPSVADIGPGGGGGGAGATTANGTNSTGGTGGYGGGGGGAYTTGGTGGQGFIVIRYVPAVSTTTLGDGTDGGNSTIGPGASATEIDRFSLVTSSGTDTVTGLTVTLGPAGAFNNLGTVGVYTTGDVLKCSSSSWGGDLTVELTSCAIDVTTTPTDYVVKITPLSHASMPAVPGASYATVATVTSITATNSTAGTDTDSATITVDNASPAGVTSATATPGNTVVDLAWTNPGDGDYNNTIVLMRAGSAVADVPEEGTDAYGIDDPIGTSVVVCITASQSCQVTGLTNGTAYYFKIFNWDTKVNYDAGVVPTGSPATPTGLADVYWVGGSGNWSDAANHWAASSNGAPGAGNLPTASSIVNFDSSSCASACAIAIDSSVTVDDFILDETDATITASGTVTATGDMTVTAGTFRTAQAVDGSVNVTGTLLVDTSGTFVVRYKSLSVPDSGGSGQTITAGTLTINGSMNADGQGFAYNSGPGAGSYASGGSGGGYGGVGGHGAGSAAGGVKYGSATSPVSLGSGGGTNSTGVSGAGAIKLVVSGNITVAGTLSAIGESDTSPRGGGSGGSIWISSGTILGAGTISVAGGVGGQGGGGGGRLDISGTTNSFTGTLNVAGGLTSGTSGGNLRGRAGTIAFPASQLSNFTVSSNLTLGNDITYAFGDLTITNNSTLTLDGNHSNGSGNGTGGVITATNITIDAGSTLSADTQGFGPSPSISSTYYGPGSAYYSSGGAGGGHGGEGGATSAAGGGTYGSITNPTSLGSSGGSNGYGANTAGGGAISLTVSNLLSVAGTISANGSNPGSPFGAGSGGSVNITTGTISGSGTIRANGASTTYGGGGGGRVAVKLTSGSSFGSLAIQARGGTGTNGAAGTVYTETSSQTGGLGVLTINNNNVSTAAGTDTSISSLVTDASVGSIEMTASNAGKLTVESSQTLTTVGTGTTLNIGTGATLTNNGTLSLGGTTFTNSGTLTHGGSSTITYTGQTDDSAVTILNTAYQSLTVNNSGTTFSLPANTTLLGSLTVTAGIFSQGATYNLISGAVSVGASGTWSNIGTGDITLSGDVSNAGTITIQSNNSTACGGADDIVIASSAASQRTWSGAGTFNIYNVSASYQAGSITVYNSTDGGNNGWTFGAFGCLTDAYWVGGTGNWSDATTHWATVSGGSPGAGNIPLSTTNVHFDASSGSGTVTIDVGSVTVADLNKSSGNITLATDVNGITVTGDLTNTGTISGATAVTLNGASKSIIGASGGAISAPVVLGDTRTVAVASGTFTMSGIISGASYGLSKTGAGRLTLSAANTFGGGITIKAGTVTGQSNVSSLGGSGTGAITLGDTSGSSSATLETNNSYNYANPVTVASGSSGTKTWVTGNTQTLSGAITLNDNLTFNPGDYAITTFTGGITGTGNIIINHVGTNSGSVTFSTNTINMTGSITNSSSGNRTVTISSVIGTNVTGVVQNSATSQLNLSGVNTFTSGLTIRSGTVHGSTSANAFGANANVITLGHTSGSANTTLTNGSALTFANPIAVASGNSGTATIITGAGVSATYNGAVTLSNNLTLTTDASNNSGLTLSGGVTGTGNLVLNPQDGGYNLGVTLSTNTVNMTGTITHSGGGRASISSVIGSNVTGVVQDNASYAMYLSGVNTFTSGLTIRAGTVFGSASANAFGANASVITLGHTSGSANTAIVGDARTFANPITVASGSSGTKTVYGFDSTYSGAVTLNDNVTLTNDGANQALTMSGGFTGTGNITINQLGSGYAKAITLSTGSVNMVGTITNSSSGTDPVNISAAIGSNVTDVIQNSATSALTLSGTNTYTGPVTSTLGTLKLAETNTFSTLTIGAGATTTITAGKTITISSLVSNGNSGSLAYLNSSSAGSAGTLSKSSGSVEVSYLSVKDSTVTGGATWFACTANGSVDVSGNTGWNFASCGGTPNLSLLHYRWRNDYGPEDTAAYALAEDTAITGNLLRGDRIRLRFLVSNTGDGSATGYTYRLETASTSCSAWLTVPTSAAENSHWIMDSSSYVMNATLTTDSAGLTNPGGKTFTPGYVMTNGNTTPAMTVTSTQFTEIEYSMRSTAYATAGTTYCFRLTNAGSTTNFTYTTQPQVSITTSIVRPEAGGGGIGGENPGSGPQRTGGGSSGGSSADEGTGGGGNPVGGGGSGGGGGGDIGFLINPFRMYLLGLSPRTFTISYPNLSFMYTMWFRN